MAKEILANINNKFIIDIIPNLLSILKSDSFCKKDQTPILEKFEREVINLFFTK